MSEISEPQTSEQVLAEELEEIEVDAPLVGIIMGSPNDKPKMQPAGRALQEAGIRYEVRVMSAHRDPEMVREYCQNARMRGLKVIIAGAGMSAALPGVAAAHTDLPVIGVPILGKSLGGLDALLSAVQMPPGIPVACVAIDGAKNAGPDPRDGLGRKPRNLFEPVFDVGRGDEAKIPLKSRNFH